MDLEVTPFDKQVCKSTNILKVVMFTLLVPTKRGKTDIHQLPYGQLSVSVNTVDPAQQRDHGVLITVPSWSFDIYDDS